MKVHSGIQQVNSEHSENTYLAGQKVPPGTYRQVGTLRSIHLESEDYLPASLNGRVAVYVKRPPTFAELLKMHFPLGKTG